jgi:hypothetical protein
MGAITLDGAKVVTLSDRDARGWGETPSGKGWNGPVCGESCELRGVRLGLNGFAYSDLHEEQKTETGNAPYSIGNRKISIARTWLHPNSDYIKPRLDWLMKQIPDGRINEQNFFPFHYIQLARVLRNEGYMRESDRVSAHAAARIARPRAPVNASCALSAASRAGPTRARN